MKLHNNIRYPHASEPRSLTFRQVATAYGFPLSKATGKGCRVGIIELGGGVTTAQIITALAEQYVTIDPSQLTIKTYGSGRNAPNGPSGADGEVQSDILGVLEVAPGALVRVYFAGNTDSDFLGATAQALAENDVVSLSWGGPEDQWDASMLDKFAAVIQAAATKGVPLFVAAGDNGSDDGTSSVTVDFPASAPASIACGGTRLTLTSGGARDAETTWDDDPTSSATGGGVSQHFPGRDVPDVAGNADPDTGYQVTIDHDDVVIGGTSLVAPLFTGLYALLWELNGGRAFDFRGLVVANPSVCFDVTSGNNGAFRAGPGRDETTGFGVPDGGRMLTALTTGAPAPTPPASTPTAFPTAAVQTWLNGKHTYTKAEANAATALIVYASALGIHLTASFEPIRAPHWWDAITRFFR